MEVQQQSPMKRSASHIDYNPSRLFAWEQVIIKGSWTARHYRLRDLQSGDFVAEFTGSAVGRKLGSLKVNVDFGEDFFMMVLLTIMSVLEMEKRISDHISMMVTYETLANCCYLF